MLTFCYNNNMVKILVQPISDYFVAFLSTRGINVSSENPDVIHYFGDSKRKLKKLVSQHNPDLTVLHNMKAFDLDYKFPFVLDEIHCDKDIYMPKQVSTNSPDLAKLHYRSFGLDRIIHDCNIKKKEEQKQKLQINASTVKRIFTAMMWD